MVSNAGAHKLDGGCKRARLREGRMATNRTEETLAASPAEGKAAAKGGAGTRRQHAEAPIERDRGTPAVPAAREKGDRDPMKVSFKLGLLAVVAVFAVAAMAGAAQAQVIHPNNTAVSGVADFPTLDYEGVVVQCDEGTAAGTTGTDQSFIDLGLTFSGNCNINGLDATVTCSTLTPSTGAGGARLIALNATTNEGTVDLNSGFFCDVVVAGVCTVSVDGPQNPADSVSSADLFGEGTGDPKIDANVDVAATRTGSSLCGPATGTGNFTGLYDVTPTNVSID